MFDEDRRPQAYWVSEEIEIVFTGTYISNDYGVPGSPIWTEIADVEIEEITIMGVTVQPKDLPKDLLEKMHDLNEEIEW
jgi:hypothetical protein